MNVRNAGAADETILRSLWEALETELGRPDWAREPWEEAWVRLLEHAADGVLVVAEADDAPVGYLAAEFPGGRRAFVGDLYVVPAARRQGIARRLLGHVVDAARARGIGVIALEVLATSSRAREMGEGLGFAELARTLWAGVDDLGARLEGSPRGASLGSIHVQTDDLDSVVRAVRATVPRLPGGSRGSVVVPPDAGWTGVYDELCDRDPAMLRRLARELSDRSGAVVLQIGVEEGAVVRFVLYERGLVMDEYCSIPEYHGELPPGEVVGLAANPTVVARLTGADPQRLREVARTAISTEELPSAPEQLSALAAVLGVPAAAFGYEHARALTGAIVLRR